MSAFSPNLANYNLVRQPLTLGGKAAVLEHLTPRHDPQTNEQAQQAASDALHAAFRAAIAAPETPTQKDGL